MSYAARRSRLSALAVAVVVLLPAGSAQAAGGGGELSAIAGAYAAHGGTIPACEFTSAELNAALGQAGGDIQQYSADLLAAIQRALSAQASGACGAHAVVPPPTTTTSAPPPTQTTTTVVAAPPAPPAGVRPSVPAAKIPSPSISASSGAGLPAPIWILAIGAAVLALGAALAATAWLRGWDPAWVAAAGHSFGEARYRLSGAWAGFADWTAAQRRRAGDEVPGR